jgi:adenylate cyclase
MEIERKYLVNKDLWSGMNKPAGEYIIQGYLSTDIDKTIRVRLKGNSGYMAVKARTVGISREEFEFPVSADIAKELITKFSEGIIEKIRYALNHKGETWEVDEFLGSNKGLIIAEIELNNEEEIVELPEWVEKEVSYDKRYFNSNLSNCPYKGWKDK